MIHFTILFKRPYPPPCRKARINCPSEPHHLESGADLPLIPEGASALATDLTSAMLDRARPIEHGEPDMLGGTFRILMLRRP